MNQLLAIKHDTAPGHVSLAELANQLLGDSEDVFFATLTRHNLDKYRVARKTVEMHSLEVKSVQVTGSCSTECAKAPTRTTTEVVKLLRQAAARAIHVAQRGWNVRRCHNGSKA